MTDPVAPLTMTPEQRDRVALMLFDALVPYGRDFDPGSAARIIEGRIESLLRDAKEAAWDEALAAVVRGVESAMEAHREHGHRQIVSALSGLVAAVPRTENPYREVAR